jgi:hypothetical protein
MWLRFTISLALLPYIIIAGIINAPILLVLLGGGGTPAWELLPTGVQTWFVLTMGAPAVIAGGVLAWWPDSNDRE